MNRPPRWVPPVDLEKPFLPYKRGFSVDIRTHVPPPPFGSRYYDHQPWPSTPDEWLRNVTHTELILAQPPLESPEPREASATPATARLEITEKVAVGDGRGAQLVCCTITPTDSGQCAFEAVAKIFDPLYYPFDSKDSPYPCNAAKQADADYSCEAVAYEHIRMGNQMGQFVPRYFGSWTFQLPIRHKHEVVQRAVRLVLIEHLEGPTMQDVGRIPNACARYDEEYRLEIVARILDGYVKLFHSGVHQRDLTSRNIVLVGLPHPGDLQGPTPPTYPRPVLIDFNISHVSELTKYGKLPSQLTELPPNPRFFFGSNRLEFGDWLPEEWERNFWLQQKWLRRRFVDDREVASLYAPLPKHIKF